MTTLSILQFLPTTPNLHNLIHTLILWQPQIIFLLDTRTHEPSPQTSVPSLTLREREQLTDHPQNASP
jgi:hypothetical protein